MKITSDKPVCVLTEIDWVPDDAVLRLEEIFTVHKGPFTTKELVTKMQKVEGCFVGLDHIIGPDMFGSNLRFIASPTTGLNHIDLDHAVKNAVQVISLKGESAFLENITATAELCWGLIIALRRHIPEAFRSVRLGQWDRDKFCGVELQGSTIGIIGYGRLGRKVARYAEAFNMKILVNTPQEINDVMVEQCSLEKLLVESDIVTLHADSRHENYHMISLKEFELMKRNAVFINTARGDLVDENAIIHALQNSLIAGAALDVVEAEFNNEHTSQHLMDYAKTHNNLIITPHIGGVTHNSQYATTHFTINKLISWWGENGSN